MCGVTLSTFVQVLRARKKVDESDGDDETYNDDASSDTTKDENSTDVGSHQTPELPTAEELTAAAAAAEEAICLTMANGAKALVSLLS